HTKRAEIHYSGDTKHTKRLKGTNQQCKTKRLNQNPLLATPSNDRNVNKCLPLAMPKSTTKMPTPNSDKQRK
ncbi:20176_t:CDS:2, partial [Gigaspora rosea]